MNVTALHMRHPRSLAAIRAAGNVVKAAAPIVLPAILILVSVNVLASELRSLDGAALRQSLQSLSPASLAGALLLSFASYALLSAAEWLGFSFIGKSPGRARALFVSFAANAIAHSVGFGLLTGGSVRYRLYRNHGLTSPDVAALSLFSSVTFGVGSACLLAWSALLSPDSFARVFPAGEAGALACGIVTVIALSGYVLATRLPGPVTRYLAALHVLPTPRIAVLQLLTGSLDLIATAGVIYLLLPSAPMSFATFASCFVVATWAGLASSVPGGIGIFEAVMLALLPGIARHDLLAALLAYRVLYYIVPLALAVVLIVINEYAWIRTRIVRVRDFLDMYASPFIATAVSIMVFLGGIVLLVSGATPTLEARMSVLKGFLPLPLIEVSHMIGSVSGTALLLLANGLFKRLDGAYVMTTVVLALGIGVSMLKGLDYEEAIVLTLILALLAWSRREFYRRSSLLAEPFTPGWAVSVGMAIIGSIWLGLFAYRDVQYQHLLWVNFTFDGDASRFLRASVIVSACAIGYAALRLTRPARPNERPSENDVECAMAIARQSSDTVSQLVCMGDKSILFSQSRRSFLMYAVRGQSCIALAGPIGDPQESRELAWRFREFCDAHDIRPVFYQVSATALPLYLDLGLSIVKLGEEGFVDLRNFSLDGKRGKDLRLARNRALRDGMAFDIIPAADVLNNIDRLNAISQAWLETQGAAEKGFSLGSFSPAYLQRFNVAVVRLNGEIVAFANLLESLNRAELSIDLMRHTDEASGAMDFLFAEMMLWGAAQGYQRFNLGMAPLSGLESRPLAPLWHRAGSLIYRHGEAFYNFKPEWQPRYLAFPGGLSLPYVLFDVGTLVSGGLKELISK
jgi:phosphatidylglycerol lysyltransferase